MNKNLSNSLIFLFFHLLQECCPFGAIRNPITLKLIFYCSDFVINNQTLIKTKSEKIRNYKNPLY